MMQIEMISVNDLVPYEKNPRKNDQSVDKVAESIREFGFRSPVVIDRHNVVVCGHTRLKAAKKLKLQTVPCIRADDLTDEQIRAYRLADNKAGEDSEWDMDLLDEELADIFDLDMERFGFLDEEPEEKDDEDDDGYYGDERERTAEGYNLGQFDAVRSAGFYQMPVIEPDAFVPDDLIGFNYMLSTKRRDAGVHFFIDDYQFERIWNDPTR